MDFFKVETEQRIWKETNLGENPQVWFPGPFGRILGLVGRDKRSDWDSIFERGLCCVPRDRAQCVSLNNHCYF